MMPTHANRYRIVFSLHFRLLRLSCCCRSLNFSFVSFFFGSYNFDGLFCFSFLVRSIWYRIFFFRYILFAVSRLSVSVHIVFVRHNFISLLILPLFIYIIVIFFSHLLRMRMSSNGSYKKCWINGISNGKTTSPLLLPYKYEKKHKGERVKLKWKIIVLINFIIILITHSRNIQHTT